MKIQTCSFLLTCTVLTIPLSASANCGGACQGVCGESDQTAAATAAAPAGKLSRAETRHLLLMQDEEKLARDVYNAFAKKWALRPFENIGTRSEPAHLAAVTDLLQRYAVRMTPQPAEAGAFRSPDMKKLYDQLIAQGSASAEAALKVGAEIEELDIKDLREGAARARNEEVRTVYRNLEEASIRHLNAFHRNLTARGVTYTPKHLDAAAYRELVEER